MTFIMKIQARKKQCLYILWLGFKTYRFQSYLTVLLSMDLHLFLKQSQDQLSFASKSIFLKLIFVGKRH